MRMKTKRLTKKQIHKIWEEKNEEYFPLGYHWQLYKLIKDNPGITVKEICEAMPEYYPYKESEHNFTNVPSIYEDIDYLMSSARIEKIIIKDNGTFRLGNEEECNEYAEKIYQKAKKLMAKYGAIVRRIRKDKQGKLYGTSMKEIDENSDARPFVESFAKSASEMAYEELCSNCEREHYCHNACESCEEYEDRVNELETKYER